MDFCIFYSLTRVTVQDASHEDTYFPLAFLPFLILLFRSNISKLRSLFSSFCGTVSACPS
jgi:hypothetical protein